MSLGSASPDAKKDRAIGIEYSHLQKNAPAGVFVMPSLESLRVWHGVIFVRKGGVLVGDGDGNGDGDSIGPQGMAILGTSGTSVELTATEEGTQIIVLSGQPLNEPIAARGPFVMNTDKELMEANRDFRSGRMGR